MVSFRLWFRVHVSCPRLRTESWLEVNAWLNLYFILLNKLVPAFHKQISNKQAILNGLKQTGFIISISFKHEPHCSRAGAGTSYTRI